MKQLFAAIADDVTGGSDLAGMLFEAGVPTIQTFGIPTVELLDQMRDSAQAVVLSLKSRSIPAADAIALTLKAHSALRSLNPRQLYFKYCSTFDSTPDGNIGPVTEALLSATQARYTIAVPALPVNGRTQYLGHLFVNGRLLSESPLRHHPLNPMDDPDVVRHLQRQTKLRVGLIDLPTVQCGADAMREKAQEADISLADAVSEADLSRIAEAFVDAPFLTGGSGLAKPLANLWSKESVPKLEPQASSRTLIIAGSCSAATLTQLNNYGAPILRLGDNIESLLNRHGTALVASSAAPADRDPSPGASTRIEVEFAKLALHAYQNLGVRRFIIAGGETSGAVVDALGVQAARITGIVTPGVPALQTLDSDPVNLVLKSGNFGESNFFYDALNRTTSH